MMTSNPNSHDFGWRLEVRDLDLFEIERRMVVAFRPRLFSIMDEWTRYPIDMVPIAMKIQSSMPLKGLSNDAGHPKKSAAWMSPSLQRKRLSAGLLRVGFAFPPQKP